MQIVFVRHGESEANAINDNGYQMFTGQWDCGLTEHGRAEAENLRGNPVFNGAEVFFVSDLQRARETASCFAEPGKTVLDSRLRERSLGDFEGKSVAEIQNDSRYARYFHDPKQCKFRADFIAKAPNGENYSDVCRRVRAFWEDVRTRGYRKIVIVSHFATIRCFMKELQGLSEEETLRIHVATCTPIVLDV